MSIVKRIIGLPGDIVEVRGMQVFINGEVLREPYARWINGGSKDFGPAKVSSGSVFVLGDSRDTSKDSRYYENPFIDFSQIEGRALYVYWDSNSGFERTNVRLEIAESG